MDTKVAPCIKADLINTYSNLLYRTTGVAINPDQVIPRFDVDTFRRHASDQARTMLQDLLSLPGISYRKYMQNINYNVEKKFLIIIICDVTCQNQALVTIYHLPQI